MSKQARIVEADEPYLAGDTEVCCLEDARTTEGVTMVCGRPEDHEGPHFDDFDGVSWVEEDEP